MAERELSAAPSMLGLLARAGMTAIPGAGRLPFVGGGGGEIPSEVLTLGDVRIDRDRLAAYDRVCGFGFGNTLPPTYPHMLAFALHMALMTDGRFPFPAIGLVHIANEICQRRPIDAREQLSLRVWAGPLQPHPRGRMFAIHSEARVGEELVWTEVSTNLRRGAGAEPVADGRGADSAPPSSEALPATATWRCPGDLGRRYGSVSGDLNPIHIHSLSARLFGFPSAIAHGMWSKARCSAALGPELGAAFTVQVAFKRPILLPATVNFAEARVGDGIAFGVSDAQRGTPHLNGSVSFGEDAQRPV